jgi:hypothetical protein
MSKVLIKPYKSQKKIQNHYAVYGAILRKDMCNNICNLFVIPFKVITPPLRSKKLWALHDINGIQNPHMGCTKMLTSEKTRQVHFTDQQQAISRPRHYVKLTVVQTIYVQQCMYGFAKAHNYINVQCTDISSTMYNNERLTYIRGWWMLVTTGQEMFLQNMFVRERLIAHITAIWTLSSMYTLMDLPAAWFTERFITHITAIWTLPSMYTLMDLQAGWISERSITNITAIWTLPSMYTLMDR